MTHYLAGPAVAASLAALAIALFKGSSIASYLQHFVPLAAAVVLVRMLAGRLWTPGTGGGSPILGTALALGLWPVYTAALLMALLRLRLPHLPTPKEAKGGRFWPLVAPQLAMVALIAGGFVYELRHRGLADGWLTVAATAAAIGLHGALFFGVREGATLRRAPAPVTHAHES
jgi:cellulose synthase (UDP-forming)